MPLSLTVEFGDDCRARITTTERLRDEQSKRDRGGVVTLAKIDVEFFAQLMNVLVTEDIGQTNFVTVDQLIDSPNHFVGFQGGSDFGSAIGIDRSPLGSAESSSASLLAFDFCQEK